MKELISDYDSLRKKKKKKSKTCGCVYEYIRYFKAVSLTKYYGINNHTSDLRQ